MANIQNTTSQSVLACLACFIGEFFVGYACYRLWRIGDACTTTLVPQAHDIFMNLNCMGLNWGRRVYNPAAVLGTPIESEPHFAIRRKL
jgi:hypothetical protein